VAWGPLATAYQQVCSGPQGERIEYRISRGRRRGTYPERGGRFERVVRVRWGRDPFVDYIQDGTRVASVARAKAAVKQHLELVCGLHAHGHKYR
jgi:hypothetical protein